MSVCRERKGGRGEGVFVFYAEPATKAVSRREKEKSRELEYPCTIDTVAQRRTVLLSEDKSFVAR